eukprot:4879021-Pyramimonas_sp.AAC.3
MLTDRLSSLRVLRIAFMRGVQVAIRMLGGDVDPPRLDFIIPNGESDLGCDEINILGVTCFHPPRLGGGQAKEL